MEIQSLSPDVFSSRARDARGRFAEGHSGNPRGRPPGIPNPKRRLLDFANRPPAPGALAALLDRKPYLLRRFAQQVFPPRPPEDAATRLGIDVSAVQTREDLGPLVCRLWDGIARGEIAPEEAVQIIRRARRRLRLARRIARITRRAARLAHKTGAASRPLG